MLGSELQNKRKQDRKQDVYKLYSQGQNILPKVRSDEKIISYFTCTRKYNKLNNHPYNTSEWHKNYAVFLEDKRKAEKWDQLTKLK